MTASTRVAALVVVLLAVLPVAPAGAGEWGGIVAGTTTMSEVRARYGEPTRNTMQKLDGRDSAQWVYEGAQAPVGMMRMTLDFGLLAAASAYRPDVVRTFTLQPKPGVFTRTTVVNGWGVPRVPPTGGGNQMFFYEEGLLVAFDKEGWIVESMTFTPPQPHQADPEPRRP
ncbi:MAG TPA: hypothetical protein VGL09_12525 [Methylomirabilota bacterium]